MDSEGLLNAHAYTKKTKFMIAFFILASPTDDGDNDTMAGVSAMRQNDGRLIEHGATIQNMAHRVFFFRICTPEPGLNDEYL